jgi:hypothetical protein
VIKSFLKVAKTVLIYLLIMYAVLVIVAGKERRELGYYQYLVIYRINKGDTSEFKARLVETLIGISTKKRRAIFAGAYARHHHVDSIDFVIPIYLYSWNDSNADEGI